jgi:hypothetical protein
MNIYTEIRHWCEGIYVQMVNRYRQRKIKHPENKNVLWYELLLQDSSKNKESKLTKKC